MAFLRYSPCLATGAAGLLTGLYFNKISNNRQFLISAADEVTLEIDRIISKDVQAYVNKYAPMMRHGFPSYDTLRVKENFIISYDRRNKVPNWVMEHLTSNQTKVKCRRKTPCEDGTIHEYFRVRNNDYKESGYDKGHLAAAANHKQNHRAYEDTFVLSNMAPQKKSFNCGIWKQLEEHVRRLVEEYGSVFVCTGPLYMPRPKKDCLYELTGERPTKKRKRRNCNEESNQLQPKYVMYEVIGANEIAVPTHFFKIIVYEVGDNMYDMEAYIIPNDDPDRSKSLPDYMYDKNFIERSAGFLLFDQLPENTFRKINGEMRALESSMDL